MDDDFVLAYVKASKLNEYRPQLNYQPDFDYIVFNYRFTREEWLAFVKKFKRRFLNLFYGSFHNRFFSHYFSKQHCYLEQQFTPEMIIYFLQNQALSVHDAIDFLKEVKHAIDCVKYVSAIVSYLLDRGVKIQAEWVAKLIKDDALIARIKEKHAFTCEQIYHARRELPLSALDIPKIQQHFPKPNVNNLFDGPQN